MLSRDLADVAVTHGRWVACGMAAGGLPTRWASVDVPTAPGREPRWPGTGTELGQEHPCEPLDARG